MDHKIHKVQTEWQVSESLLKNRIMFEDDVQQISAEIRKGVAT